MSKNLNDLRIVNATPHPVRIQDKDGRIVEFPPSGRVIRVDEDVADYNYPVGNFVAVVKWTTTLTSESRKFLSELEKEGIPTLVIVSWRAGEALSNSLYKNLIIASPDSSTFFYDQDGKPAVMRLAIHSDGRLIE